MEAKQGKMQLGVMFGSRTCEHEVSIISAVQMMNAADADKYDIIPIYITKRGEWFTGEKLRDIKSYTPFDAYAKGITRVALDVTAGSGALVAYEPGKGLIKGEKRRVVARLSCVIPVMHGLHGEDGSLQGMLELADIPYASTGVTGSAVGMDKIMMKQCFRGCGFPVLPDCHLLRSAWKQDPEAAYDAVEKALPYPVFVKPANLGSSIGVSRADDRASLADALELAFSYDRRVLVEKGLDRPVEVNCSVLGFDGDVRASVLEMPVTEGNMLGFINKYIAGGGAKGMASLKRVVPAPVGEDMTKRIQSLSVDIFNALDCKGVARIDFMLDRNTDELFITEINTIPGSLAFYLWAESGMPYGALIDRLVDCAMTAHREKNENDYAFTSDILSGVTLGTKGAKGVKGGVKG